MEPVEQVIQQDKKEAGRSHAEEFGFHSKGKNEPLEGFTTDGPRDTSSILGSRRAEWQHSVGRLVCLMAEVSLGAPTFPSTSEERSSAEREIFY